jgi:hypothetical protein
MVFHLVALQTEGLICISVYPNIIETEFVWLSNTHYCQGLRCITSPLYLLSEQSLSTDTALPLPYKSATEWIYVRFEVSTAVTMMIIISQKMIIIRMDLGEILQTFHTVTVV